MRQNRKREPLRLGTVAKSLIACMCVAIFGLLYVYGKNHINQLGDEIAKREATLTAAEKRNTMLAAQLAQSKSPSVLEQRCQQYNLGLVAPKDTQVVRVYEPGPEWDVQLVKPANPVPAIAARMKMPATATAKKPQPEVALRR
jgi:cell division protein FtsB